MSLTRYTTESTYISTTSLGEQYSFTVVQDLSGVVCVKNISTPTGSISDAYVTLPQEVTDDIATAMGELEDLMASSSVSGTLEFADEASKEVAFETAMNTDTYRVYVSIGDFVPFKITNKTVDGFTLELGATYTGDIGYDVFV